MKTSVAVWNKREGERASQPTGKAIIISATQALSVESECLKIVVCRPHRAATETAISNGAYYLLFEFDFFFIWVSISFRMTMVITTIWSRGLYSTSLFSHIRTLWHANVGFFDISFLILTSYTFTHNTHVTQYSHLLWFSVLLLFGDVYFFDFSYFFIQQNQYKTFDCCCRDCCRWLARCCRRIDVLN